MYNIILYFCLVPIMSSRRYQVVEFLPDNELAVVPINWLMEDGETNLIHCYWPSFKNSDKLNKSVRNAIPPDAEWQVYRCRPMGQPGKILAW